MTSTMQLQKKKRSKILNKLLSELSPDFGKLQMKVDAVFEKARKEGFSDLEIGEFVRSQLQVSYSSRTIQRVLPDRAKHTEFANKADKMSASEHGKEPIELPGDKVKVSKSLTDVEPNYVEGIDNDSYLPGPNKDGSPLTEEQQQGLKEYNDTIAQFKQQADPVKFEQEQQDLQEPQQPKDSADLEASDSEFNDCTREVLIWIIKKYRVALDNSNKKITSLEKQIAEVQPFIDYLQAQTPDDKFKKIEHYQWMNEARGKTTAAQTEDSDIKSESQQPQPQPDKESTPVKKKSKGSNKRPTTTEKEAEIDQYYKDTVSKDFGDLAHKSTMKENQ